MLYEGSYEVGERGESVYRKVMMVGEMVCRGGVGMDLVVGKYVGVEEKRWGYEK